MEAVSYGEYKIEQSGSKPAPGDKVMNISNGEISIKDKEGNKLHFEVRDGVITREIAGFKMETTIMAVIFAVMTLLMILLMWLWLGVR